MNKLHKERKCEILIGLTLILIFIILFVNGIYYGDVL